MTPTPATIDPPHSHRGIPFSSAALALALVALPHVAAADPPRTASATVHVSGTIADWHLGAAFLRVDIPDEHEHTRPTTEGRIDASGRFDVALPADRVVAPLALATTFPGCTGPVVAPADVRAATVVWRVLDAHHQPIGLLTRASTAPGATRDGVVQVWVAAPTTVRGECTGTGPAMHWDLALVRGWQTFVLHSEHGSTTARAGEPGPGVSWQFLGRPGPTAPGAPPEVH